MSFNEKFFRYKINEFSVSVCITLTQEDIMFD